MSLFDLRLEEILTFIAVLIRFSILFSLLPFIGDRLIPAPIKVLTALAASIAMFPLLVESQSIRPADARMWGASLGGIVSTVFLESFFAILLGFTARFAFEGISFGAHLVGNLMGFASASIYDPHQEAQTEVVAQIQTSIAMLVFLALDGHCLLLKASLDSYKIVGLGRVSISHIVGKKLVEFSSEIFLFGIQIAAPVALTLFALNLAFGIVSKAMPQLNILVLSFAVSALIGFAVIYLSVPEFCQMTASIFEQMHSQVQQILLATGGRR